MVKDGKPYNLYVVSTLIILSSIISGGLSFPIAAFGAGITGTAKDDTLYGTMADDDIAGKEGKDTLFGSGGSDTIDGNAGDDYIQGDNGDDVLKGWEGDDIIIGGPGADKINGGLGADYLESSFVVGSTSISDMNPDAITCGDGIDTAFINPSDGDTASADCEIVISTP